MSAITLKNIENPRWSGNPEGESTGITGTVASQPAAGKIDVALTGLSDGYIPSRVLALNATTGALIQSSEKWYDSDGNGAKRIRFDSATEAGMVYADGYTVNLMIIFTNGRIWVGKNVKA